MVNVTIITDLLLLPMSIAAGLLFMQSAVSFTPGRVRKMVTAGGMVVGLLMVGEMLTQVGQYVGGIVSALEYLGYLIIISGFVIFMFVMYEGSRFEKLFGFGESELVRRLRKPEKEK